jgi:hypothetical protein
LSRILLFVRLPLFEGVDILDTKKGPCQYGKVLLVFGLLLRTKKYPGVASYAARFRLLSTA